mgnify:CR=1 FL=1
MEQAFQFHKGTIRTGIDAGSKHIGVYFNSIKVQLERNPSTQITRLLEFQFHKGTIRTLVEGSRRLFDLLFQFHKGTIRT